MSVPRGLYGGAALIAILMSENANMELRLIQGGTQVDTDPRGLAARQARRDRLALQLSGMAAPQVVRVSADQFYPTPDDLAERAAYLLNVSSGERFLEPSAGSGALIRGMQRMALAKEICAVEQSQQLADMLPLPATAIHCGDFLQFDPTHLGTFDGVIMNPPFRMGSDITHIRHALRFLRPGGRLVAICANGPRQAAQLRPLTEANGGCWEALPDGTFKQAGTMVRTALLKIRVA
jgi:SAM-dependent methyltransferase